MKSYKFVFSDKEYELSEENCDYFLNDEEVPVTGIDQACILELLEQGDEVQFDIEYYDEPCGNCLAGKEEKAKVFKFLEYHFYIFTKNGEYVTANISKEYENISFNRLLRSGKADNSYIVSVMVCVNCGNYSIEIEQCEV